MKKSLTKILGLATLAMAAIFMTGCPTDPNKGKGEPEPGTQESTIDTRIAIDTSAPFTVDDSSVDLSTWENIYFYAYETGVDAAVAVKPFGDWPGIKAEQIGESAVYYANFPSTLASGKAFAIIATNNDGSQIDLAGAISKGDVKIYKIVDGEAGLEDWDAAGANDDDPAAVEPEQPIVQKYSGKITVAVSKESSKITGATVVNAHIYNDTNGVVNLTGDWPGKALTLNEELGIYVLELDVTDQPYDTWTVLINGEHTEDGADEATKDFEQFGAGSVKINETKLYNRINDWVTWDGTSKDTSEAATLNASSTIIAIDISKIGTYARNDNTEDPSKWTAVGLYTWEEELFGGFPGAELTKSDVDSNIFYLDVTGKEGKGHLIFNNNGGGEQFDSAYATIEAGKKYLVTGTGDAGFTEWTDFELSKIVAE